MLKTLPLVLLLGCSCDAKLTKFRIQGELSSEAPRFSQALYQATRHRLLPGHRVSLTNNGPVFERLEEEIGRATQSINVVLFIWREGEPSDRIVRALTARARAGVRCRVMVDAVGSMGFEKALQPQLEAAGCETKIFRPLKQGPTLERNHRKLFIFDGKLAVTGGFGIDKTWLGDGRKPDQWRDSNAFVTGPAVLEMQQAFAENWQEATGRLLPEEDFPQAAVDGPTWATYVESSAAPAVTKAERLTQMTIASAQKRLWIVNAYFIPSPGMIALLQERRAAGVDVQVMVSGPLSDHAEVLREQRATYPDLLKAGVRIYEYQPSLLHSKATLIDDHLAVVGSINFDRLSQDLMDEGALVMSDPQVVAELERYWTEDLEHCTEIPLR